MPTFTKDPDAILDYGFNWTNWLADGEKLFSSAWTVPTGITKETESHTDYASMVWLSGGTAGVTYEVINHIVTDSGREDDRTIKIKVQER
jgi:hypothetical protein